MAARFSIPSCLARCALGLCCAGLLACGAAKPGAPVSSSTPSWDPRADTPAVTTPAAASGSAGASTPVLPGAGVPAATAAGSGGTSPAPTQTGISGDAGEPSASASPLTLTPTDAKPLSGGFFAFPASAVPPTNQSPGYGWTGVPASAKSLALVFRDVSSATRPVKWILWDIPPTVTQVPANMGNSAHPMQIPGSTQLGSLGNQGYAGPCCEDHEYEWILYALDVEKLSGTERLSTAQIRNDLLLQHDLAQSRPVMMRIMP